MTKDKEYKGIKTFYAKDQESWRRWLEKNHEKETSLWLILYKKDSDTPSVYYPEAVDEALCFGWIDSKANKRDDKSYYLFFAKRNPKSLWSKVNKEKVAKLLKANKIAKAGLEAIAQAKKTGTWSGLDKVENLEMPEDLKKALSKNKPALTHFEAFPKSVKKAILEWIQNAKKPETRLKRIEETASLAAKNIRANQHKPKTS